MPPEAQIPATDLIIGQGLISAETIAQELRSRLVRRLAAERGTLLPDQLLGIARATLAEFEPILADNLATADLAAWIAGLDRVANRLPAAVVESLAAVAGAAQPSIFTISGLLDEPSPVIRFPLIDQAAQSLADRSIVTRAEFDQLADDAKRRAFTVARQGSVETIERIRDVLVQDIREGPSLAGFRREMADSLASGDIGEAHLENVYRTNIQTAFAEGHDALADNPIVVAAFPFQEILPIDDGRVRDTHFSLQFLGLNGTGVYWRNDPFWSLFMPPIEWQCRCGWNMLSVRQAARKGVQAAIEWLRTGVEPAHEFRLQFIPWRPDPDFVGGRPSRSIITI
jgi:hypothetical protein